MKQRKSNIFYTLEVFQIHEYSKQCIEEIQQLSSITPELEVGFNLLLDDWKGSCGYCNIEAILYNLFQPLAALIENLTSRKDRKVASKCYEKLADQILSLEWI